MTVPKEFLAEIKIRRSSNGVECACKKEKRSIWLPILIAILVVMIVVGVYLFFKLPKADIVIWPKVDTLSFQQTITADKSVDVS